MLVLLDNDFDRLLAAVSAQLVRAGDGTHQASATTSSLLAWAAHRRVDRKQAEKLGRRAVAEFSARAEDTRLPGDQARLVRNLLRTGLPKEARRAHELATTRGSRVDPAEAHSDARVHEAPGPVRTTRRGQFDERGDRLLELVELTASSSRFNGG